jgi:hypothetical protein
MRVEEEYLDVLQNIEFAVVSFYRAHRDLSDGGVMRVYEALIDRYFAEGSGREPRDFGLSDQEQELLESAGAMCQWRLGRESIAPAGKLGEPPPPIDREALLRCLKRLLKSATKWNRDGGQQGYLDFVSQYVR